MLTCKYIKKYKHFPVEVKASLWYLVCTFLQKGISVISTPIFTRIMSTEEYGQFSVFNTWFTVLSIVVTLYLFYGVHTPGLVKFPDNRNEFTSSLEGLNSALIVFWIAIYLLFHQSINTLLSLNTHQMLMMFSLMWTYGCFRFWSNEQRVNYSYKKLVVVTVSVSVSKPLIEMLLVVFSKEKATARITGWLLVEMVAYSWIFIHHIRKGRVVFSAKYWKYSICFCVPLIPHFLSQTVLNSSDRIMIQRLVGESEAGIYSLAYSIALLMTLVNMALIQTLNPWLYQKIKDRKILDIRRIAKITIAIVACCNLLLILVAPEAVFLFAPKTYQDAIWIIPPVAMSALFMFMYDFFSCFAFYYEKTRLIMLGSVLVALLNIALNFVFISFYGYIAAGYTTLVGYIGFAIIHFCIMKSICRKEFEGVCPFNGSKILIFSTGFVLCGLILLMTYRFPIIRYSLLVSAIMFIIIFRKRIYKFLIDVFAIRNQLNQNE